MLSGGYGGNGGFGEISPVFNKSARFYANELASRARGNGGFSETGETSPTFLTKVEAFMQMS